MNVTKNTDKMKFLSEEKSLDNFPVFEYMYNHNNAVDNQVRIKI